MFSCEFCDIFVNSFLTENLRVNVYASRQGIQRLKWSQC